MGAYIGYLLHVRTARTRQIASARRESAPSIASWRMKY
jgi:hypothetical protein